MHAHGYSSVMGSTGRTNCILMKGPLHGQTYMAWCYRSSLEPVFGELAAHSKTLTSKCMSLYLCATLRPLQRSLFVQWMVVNTETQNWSKCRGSATKWGAQPQMAHQHHLLIKGTLRKARWKDCKSWRVGNSDVKCCLLGMVWLWHLHIHSNWCCLCRVCIGLSGWIWEGHCLGKQKAANGWWKRGNHSL